MRKQKQATEPLHKKREKMMSSLFSDLPELCFTGNREVVIEGSKGVLEYSENIIRINTTLGLVCFEGRGLNLKCISSYELIVEGYITKVEFVI